MALDHTKVKSDPLAFDAVSSALTTSLASSADLLTAVDDIAPAWEAELADAREIARRKQETVLAHRACLHKSLDHGASLTNAFTSPPSFAQHIPALAASRVATTAVALKNISHTLHLHTFLTAAPALIADAVSMLDRVSDAAPASPGIASDLFYAHENIAACERVRDLSLLDALPNLSHAAHVAEIFAGVDPARDQLEHYLIANIFSAVPRYAHTDPRVLVAAVRVVQREVQEDAWWRRHIAQAALTPAAGSLVRSFGSRDYYRHMRDAIVKSIDHAFRSPPSPVISAKERDSADLKPVASASTSASAYASVPASASHLPASTSSPSRSPHSSSSSLSVKNMSFIQRTLTWINKLVTAEQDMRRFIVPCFPPSYDMGNLFTTEYHRCIMAVIGDLFHAADTRHDVDESDLVSIVQWYGNYRHGPAGAAATGGLMLPSDQTDRLVTAVSRHAHAKLLARVDDILAEDADAVVRDSPSQLASRATRVDSQPISSSSSVIIGTDRGQASVDDDGGSRGAGGVGSGSRGCRGLCTTAAPELIFRAIGDLIKDIGVLSIPSANTAVAHVVSEILSVYQNKVRHLLVPGLVSNEASMLDSGRLPLSQTKEDYVCALANNSARCLEYAEEIRDAVVVNVEAGSRACVEEEYEAVVDDFRSNASAAVGDLVYGVSLDLVPLTRRHFAPRTGTEVMLDVIEVLNDFFYRYEPSLFPYHFEQFALGCLKQLVSQYVKPFLALRGRRSPDEKSARRRRNDGDGQRVGAVDEDGPEGKKKDKDDDVLDDDEFSAAGLSSMTAEAIVAQMDKDLTNLSSFFMAKVTLFETKQLKPAMGPLYDIRTMLTCAPTTHILADSHRTAVASTARITGAEELTLCASEVLWGLRSDVKPATLLEAASRVRARYGTTYEKEQQLVSSGKRSMPSALAWNGRHLLGKIV
jgi:hypothetical protein